LFVDLEGGSYGEFYVISKEQITNTETWKDDPSTPLEKMLFALNKYKPRNDSCLTLIRFVSLHTLVSSLSLNSLRCESDSQQRISPFEGSYARALTLAKDRASRTKPENRGKSNPKPSKDKTNTLQLALALVSFPALDPLPLHRASSLTLVSHSRGEQLQSCQIKCDLSAKFLLASE